MLVQSALLGAGSLDQRLVKSCGRVPQTARRYLAIEGRRVLADLARRLPLAATLRPDEVPSTATSDESLEMARGRGKIVDPPDWFGVIRPSRLLAASAAPGAQATDKELRLEFDPIDLPEADDDGGGEQSGESKILKLFDNPLFTSRAVSDYLRKLLGNPRSPGDGAAGAEMRVRSVRRAHEVGANARPLPTRIRFTDDGKPGAAVGVGGALYPEWDVYNNRYRPQWCRVIDFPLTAAADVSAAGVPHDDVLRRRLSRIGLGPKVLRGRADGDELDIEALIDLFIDLRCGTTTRTRLPGAPQTCPQSRCAHLARCLRIRHRYRSGRPRRARSPATGGRHAGRHARRAWRPRRRLCVSVAGPTRCPSAGDQNVRPTFRRPRPSPAQPVPTVELHAPRRRHPWCGRDSQDRGRHTKSAAGRPFGRFSL